MVFLLCFELRLNVPLNYSWFIANSASIIKKREPIDFSSNHHFSSNYKGTTDPQQYSQLRPQNFRAGGVCHSKDVGRGERVWSFDGSALSLFQEQGRSLYQLDRRHTRENVSSQPRSRIWFCYCPFPSVIGGKPGLPGTLSWKPRRDSGFDWSGNGWYSFSRCVVVNANKACGSIRFRPKNFTRHWIGGWCASPHGRRVVGFSGGAVCLHLVCSGIFECGKDYSGNCLTSGNKNLVSYILWLKIITNYFFWRKLKCPMWNKPLP